MAQQYGILSEKGVKNPDPRKQFIKDIKKWLTIKMKKYELILCLDANEEWFDKSKTILSSVKAMSESLGLTNLEKEYKGTLPSSFPQSERTIDFILASEGVLSCVDVIGRETHIKTTLGDHRGTYIDINVAKLLGIGEVDMESMPGRKLQLKDTKAGKKYLQEVNKSWNEHNVFNRMEKLCKLIRDNKGPSKDIIEMYNKIDRDVFRLCKSAENKSVHVSSRRYAWSPKLDQAIKLERL